MKVKTIEQYKILEYIKQYFNIENVIVEPIGKDMLLVIDKKGDKLEFTYANGEITYR